MADALRAQDADVTAVEWRPPGGGDPDVVADLVATYGDDRVDAANAAASRACRRRGHDRGGWPRGRPDPRPGGPPVLHAGPAGGVGGDVRAPAQRRARRLRLEGWATGPTAPAACGGRRGDLATAHSLDAAGAMCGVISPSMACGRPATR